MYRINIFSIKCHLKKGLTILKRAQTVLLLFAFVLFVGCSKDIDEYNKPALYWYTKMINSISDGDTDKADNYYSSLQSEHIGSPLLPQATFIMALIHMEEKEYLLAEHYLDEYIRRYAANETDRENAEFLIIKAKYFSFPNPRRDQYLINEAIDAAKNFKRKYPHSTYTPMVNSMLVHLLLAKAVLNETIASLYERIDKPKAAKFYRNKMAEKWINWDRVERAKVFWLREWFEGDGTSSWYSFLIPDTQSVVSRNSVQDINDTNPRGDNETK